MNKSTKNFAPIFVLKIFIENPLFQDAFKVYINKKGMIYVKNDMMQRNL